MQRGIDYTHYSYILFLFQAVAITDEGTDAIVGNISETDLMTLKADAYGALALPVGEFLIHAHHIVPKVHP